MTWCWGPREGRGALTAGNTGAVDGGHPQVGGASVKDDGEVLGGGSNADGAKVLHLPGWGQHSSVTGDSAAWPPQGLSLGHLGPPPAFPFTGLLAFVSLFPVYPSFKAQPGLPCSLKSSPIALLSPTDYSLPSLLNAQ